MILYLVEKGGGRHGGWPDGGRPRWIWPMDRSRGISPFPETIALLESLGRRTTTTASPAEVPRDAGKGVDGRARRFISGALIRSNRWTCTIQHLVYIDNMETIGDIDAK